MISNLYKGLLTALNLKSTTLSEEACLTFVGVGPGDPNLLTIAAVNAIKKASLVAYPVSKIGSKSFALQIVIELIQKKKCLPILFPMVTNAEELQTAWERASEQLLEEVSNGEQVVLLCQGDPSLFATSSYIILYLKSKYPSCPIKVIPGVTSFTAAAALAKSPLSLQKEELLIAPAPDNSDQLMRMLDDVNNSQKVLVLLKVGKRWPWVRKILEEKNLLEATVFASKIGLDDQQISFANQINEQEIPYFSLLIVKRTSTTYFKS